MDHNIFNLKVNNLKFTCRLYSICGNSSPHLCGRTTPRSKTAAGTHVFPPSSSTPNTIADHTTRPPSSQQQPPTYEYFTREEESRLRMLLAKVHAYRHARDLLARGERVHPAPNGDDVAYIRAEIRRMHDCEAARIDCCDLCLTRAELGFFERVTGKKQAQTYLESFSARGEANNNAKAALSAGVLRHSMPSVMQKRRGRRTLAQAKKIPSM